MDYMLCPLRTPPQPVVKAGHSQFVGPLEWSFLGGDALVQKLLTHFPQHVFSSPCHKPGTVYLCFPLSSNPANYHRLSQSQFRTARCFPLTLLRPFLRSLASTMT